FHDYFLHILPSIPLLYKYDDNNQSFWTIGTRIFEGLDPGVPLTLKVSALIYWPEVAPFFSGTLIALLLLASFYIVLRYRSPEFGYCFFAALSVFLPPVAWAHGSLLFYPLIFLCWRDRAI